MLLSVYDNLVSGCMYSCTVFPMQGETKRQWMSFFFAWCWKQSWRRGFHVHTNIVRYVKTNTAFCANGCDLLISILHCKINLREFSCISYGLDKRTTWLVRVRERLLSWLPVLLVSRKQRAPSNSIMHFVYMYSLHPPPKKQHTFEHYYIFLHKDNIVSFERTFLHYWSSYYIIGFITFLIRLNANFITFSGIYRALHFLTTWIFHILFVQIVSANVNSNYHCTTVLILFQSQIFGIKLCCGKCFYLFIWLKSTGI